MSIVKDYPKTFELKNGSQALIRILEPSDEQALKRFFLALPEHERVRYRDDVTDPQVIHQWASIIDLNRVLPLVALQDDLIIAVWTFHIRHHGWTRHLGKLRGTVLPERRKLGLASFMVHELLGLASNLEIERVVIELVPDQQDLLSLYQSLGFRIDAVLKSWVKDFKGRYSDLYMLSMQLEPAWKKMEELIFEYGTHGG